MIAPLAKLMDWSAIQAVARMMPSDFIRPRAQGIARNEQNEKVSLLAVS